jgi:hypothetical protein
MIVAGETVPVQLQTDMATLSIVVKRIVPAIAISRKMATLVVVIDLNRPGIHRTANDDML